MKHLSIFCELLSLTALIAVVFCKDVPPKNEIEEKLLNFFARWRTGDTESLPFTLPSLETISIPAMNGNYSGKGVKIEYYTSKMKLVGMNNFSVAELAVSLDDMHASGALVIPKLSISSDDYKVEGRALYVYSLKGSGKLNALFENITLTFGIKLTNNETRTNVEDFNLNFTIEGIKVDLENSSWPMNKVLNREGIQIIEKYHMDIVNATEESLVRRLDEYLTQVTPTELLDKMQANL